MNYKSEKYYCKWVNVGSILSSVEKSG